MNERSRLYENNTCSTKTVHNTHTSIVYAIWPNGYGSPVPPAIRRSTSLERQRGNTEPWFWGNGRITNITRKDQDECGRVCKRAHTSYPFLRNCHTSSRAQNCVRFWVLMVQWTSTSYQFSSGLGRRGGLARRIVPQNVSKECVFNYECVLWNEECIIFY